MAVMEYQKNGETLYKAYVQMRSKVIKRIRLQKCTYNLKSQAVARREEKRLIKELAEKLAKLEGKGLLWSEVIDRWEDAAYYNQIGRKMNTRTIKDHVNRLKRYSKPWLDKTASDLTKADGRNVLSWVKSKGGSPSLLKHLKNSINTVYEWGLEEGLIQSRYFNSKSPVYGIAIEENKNKIQPILTLEEVKALLLQAKIRQHPWYHIWAFAILTGMRSGELQALEWGDIDERNGIIRVSKSYSHKVKAVKSPKNGKWRNVDISSQLQGLILELKKIRGNEKTVLPVLSGWVEGTAGKILRMFLQSIGIEKHVVFHTLRACFATHLLSTGVEPLKVMRMGGWSDLKTFQIYLRLSGVDVKGVSEALRVLPEYEDTSNVVSLF